ncbi:uncharacterized protein TrAtP1_000291 [Trichoderma atroviride]|uniref:GYF domain-containing protein n=1 Tax=Hypocrea atroviridis (strain ATCC 20476 / IMI 206040) TaxID=452589 RepID=G9NJN9_HYPAI|nr:uncharacterized protein TRIATDRAFT_315461 [Trichoderma atroviride IMI 206040]EHK49111.1 hypothetical protein TRIATDRAFT_315461 [Trichoderma atroviride IMI 206040]UKZ58971.1 hypothetical protein TrAtP1_000291 [Trichoderma atroviride]
MPSNLPSSFASAAAGQNAARDARGGRTDGRGPAGGEWSRRDGRSANGTLTFRRSSTTPLSQSSNLPPANDNAVQPPSSEVPMAQPTTYEVGPSRYTKDDLLEMYNSQLPSGNPSHLFISGWDPSNGASAGVRGWGKSNDNHVPQDPGTCWDASGETAPIGLQGFSPEEREAFSTDINSPLKPPTQTKEVHQTAVNGRKPSLSQGPGATFGVSSPSSAVRPATRRRETVDSNPFSPSALASPTASRFSREDPLWFSRKGGDLRESENDEPDTEQASRDVPKLPIGGLMRANTSTGVSMGSMWPSSASGAGGFGNFALPTSPAAVGDKRPGGATGGSRLAHLIPKDNAEATSTTKSSEAQSPLAQSSWRTRPRTDTDPFGGDEELSGSAVLGGAQDTGSGGQQPPSRAGVLGTPVKGSAGDFGMAGLNLGGQSSGDNGPLSPSETNPYRSPPAERHDHDGQDSSAGEKIHSTGHEQQPHSNYSTLSRGFAAAFDGSDRSQTSSVGAKAFLSGGWPAPAGPSTGTPDRERSNFGGAFGSSLFSPIGDIQSPGLGNLGGVFGPSNTGSIGRASKLGSLFPPAMQAQMQAHEQESSLSDSLGDLRQSNPLGAIGRGNFGVPTRDTDSPLRSNRGVFEELFPSSDSSRNLAAFGSSDAGQPNIAATVPQSFTPVSGGLPFGNVQGGVEHPSAQVRQMVMPDRMRWVYLDPQGQIQGPFTGLEMNDWYKANFFTPDLRVKKVEDPEFEPLGQLIRRIGNSREPFLVPQIGIAHGPPMQSGPFGPGTGSGIIPPLSGVFPTFGRTLTAEEQNNLERRKQEEQFLMAQQRDFMMRQQAMAKFQMQPSLQHHSSAHSLQSQPSFGSMTSPLGVPQQQHHQLPHQQPIGAMGGPGGVFDSHPGANPAAIRAAMGNGELFRPEDLANLSTNERQMLASLQGEPTGTESGAPQPIGTPGDASRRYGLPEANELKEDDEGFKDRLQEFEELRAEHDAEQAAGIPADESQETSVKVEETTVTTVTVEPKSDPAPSAGKASKASKKKTTVVEESSLSLTQQVQKTQASAAAAASVPSPPQPTELGMPMPFPPPASTTPLPAPTAQRARSNLPEQFSRSQTATPDVVAQPPPLAPWAKEPGQEGQKGPSLKEIQEAEARKAAKAEEAAAALRKAAMEQEAALLREKEKSAAAAAANAGLPATSTWGQGSPVSSVSPWAKPGAAKAKGATPVATTGAAGAKKTLAEIQREEEARKQKAKEVAIQAGSGAPISIGKSYANLAGKPNHGPSPTIPSPIITAGSGWATVGAGGKVKSPSTIPSQLQSRSGSASSAKPVVAAPVKLVPKSIISNTSSQPANAAMDEFNKWANRELSRGITGVSDITSFQADLAVLPLDTGLIADAVYANSTTMDGRHFAEEYVRRKKLAEKGVVEKQTQAESKASSSAGGWNEVAKKSGVTQARESDAMQSADFKVVPGRKKSKK